MYRGSAVVVYAVINTCRQVISGGGGRKETSPQPATLSPPIYSQIKEEKKKILRVNCTIMLISTLKIKV